MRGQSFSWSDNVTSSTSVTIATVPAGYHAEFTFIHIFTGSNTTVEIGHGGSVVVDENYSDSYPIQVGHFIGDDGADITLSGGGSGSEGYVIVTGFIVAVGALGKV